MLVDTNPEISSSPAPCHSGGAGFQARPIFGRAFFFFAPVAD